VLSPDSFPAESFIRINAPILAFSVALALICGILFGLVPALRLSRRDSARMLPGRQTGVVAAPAKRRWSVLIAAQVALTLLLMATAGTAIRSFLGLMRTPLGYDPGNVMSIGIMAHAHVTDPGRDEGRIQSREARVAYIEQIRDKIASVRGVSMVAVATDATPPNTGADTVFEIFDTKETGDSEQPQARVILVDQRYFAALRIPLLQGRIWNADENTRGDFIAVINQSCAFPVSQPGIATKSPLRKARPGVRSLAWSAMRATTASIRQSSPPFIFHIPPWCTPTRSFSSAPRTIRSLTCTPSVSP
jgi:hypothetical protein